MVEETCGVDSLSCTMNKGSTLNLSSGVMSPKFSGLDPFEVH